MDSIQSPPAITVSSRSSGTLTVMNLFEDRKYMFNVTASNTVGHVSTATKEICEFALNFATTSTITLLWSIKTFVQCYNYRVLVTVCVT